MFAGHALVSGLLLLLPSCVHAEIGGERRQEAVALLDAAEAAVDALPAGHAARDNLRAFRGKVRRIFFSSHSHPCAAR